MSIRDSVIYDDVVGIGKAFPNLAGRRPNTNPIRLYAFPKVKISDPKRNKTWGTIKAFKASWGASVPVIYETVLPGYTYVWNIETSVLTVTNAENNAVTYDRVFNIKQLPVSWAVLKSAQFTIRVKDDPSDNDIFLIGKRVLPLKDSMQHEYKASHSDYLDENTQHGVFNILSYADIANSEERAVVANTIIKAQYDDRTILVSNAGGLQATNEYPDQLINKAQSMDSVRVPIEHGGEQFEYAHFLMIALFSNNLLTTDSKIVIEPWMLWLTFMWYFKPTHNPLLARQIFDLSPRW
jgi:hypothetical protein